MQQLAQKDLKLGQVVLTKDKKGFFPQFYVEWQFDSKFGIGPVCNWMLSYDTYGDFAVYKTVYDFKSRLCLFQGGELKVGDIILVYKGGYHYNPKYPNTYTDRNWVPAFYCGIMNGMIMAASYYNPKINKFTGIRSYPAMGKYIQ